MRLIRALTMFIGVIGIVVIIALVIGYYLYSLSPRIEGRITPVAVSADDAQNFDKKLDSLKTQAIEASQIGEKEEVSLVITEKEANSKLVQLLAEGELPLKKIMINFGDGYFLISAVMDAPGVDAKTGAIGQIEISKGKPKVVLAEFNLGKLPLPKSVKVKVEQLLNIMVNLQVSDFPVEISDVQIKNHQLTVTGTTKVVK
jgi:hypothetical protein